MPTTKQHWFLNDMPTTKQHWFLNDMPTTKQHWFLNDMPTTKEHWFLNDMPTTMLLQWGQYSCSSNNKKDSVSKDWCLSSCIQIKCDILINTKLHFSSNKYGIKMKLKNQSQFIAQRKMHQLINMAFFNWKTKQTTSRNTRDETKQKKKNTF